MKVLITSDDGEVLESIEIPMDFDDQEVAASGHIADMIEDHYMTTTDGDS